MGWLRWKKENKQQSETNPAIWCVLQSVMYLLRNLRRLRNEHQRSLEPFRRLTQRLSVLETQFEELVQRLHRHQMALASSAVTLLLLSAALLRQLMGGS